MGRGHMATAPKRSLTTRLFSSWYRSVHLISLLFVLVILPLMIFVPQLRNHAASGLTQSQLLAQQKWPNLFGKTGVYAIANTSSAVDEINKIAANGDTLFVTYYRGNT